jgi:hypothetical protein
MLKNTTFAIIKTKALFLFRSIYIMLFIAFNINFLHKIFSLNSPVIKHINKTDFMTLIPFHNQIPISINPIAFADICFRICLGRFRIFNNFTFIFSCFYSFPCVLSWISLRSKIIFIFIFIFYFVFYFF